MENFTSSSRRRRILSLLCWATALTAAPFAHAQRNPQVGYVYPAGGQKGTEFQVTLGGQYLNGAVGVYFSGTGVQAEVLKYIKPLTQQQLNELRQKLRELQRLLQARKLKSGRPVQRREGAVSGRAQKLARELGLEAPNAKAITELRNKLFNPRKQLNPQLAEIVHLRVKLTPDAELGARELRLRTAAGVSNPIAFHVAEWPEYRENEPNDRTADSGLSGRLPAVINGQILPGDVDRFRFTARKGEGLVLAVSARDLIPYLADAVLGWFQATLALYDASGVEVAYADDYRFHPDPVIRYEVPEDGDYVVEIRDAIYRGREDFVYRIALGELPFVTRIFPLGGRAGEPTTVAVEGWNLPVKQLTVHPENSPAGTQPVFLLTGGKVANRVPFVVDALPECLDVEPNDTPQGAQKIELPRIINGRIDRPGDWDVFRFEARAGDEIIAEVRARRLSSPLDSIIKLTAADGRLLVANDDHEDKGAGLTTHHADSQLRATIPADGLYYLRLGDTQNHGGAAFGYRMRISRPMPDFQLRIVPPSTNVRAGATVPIDVYALRKDGFAGDITLELKDAPPGFRLSGGWVPAGRDRIRLTLTVPGASPRASPNEAVKLLLQGGAVIHGHEIRRLAVPAEDRMQAFIYHHLVPSKDWMVAVTGRGRSPGWKLRGKEPVRLEAGGTTRVLFSRSSRAFAQELRLVLNDPPKGIAIQRVSFDRDGIVLLLRAHEGLVQHGLKGNLIVGAFMERRKKAKNPARKVQRRRVPVGTLPAIPFEIVARSRSPRSAQPSPQPP